MRLLHPSLQIDPGSHCDIPDHRTTAVGLRPQNTGLELCAPYGLSDLFGSIARPNKKQITREIYEKKLARWKALWPELTIIGWDE
ncbi:nucleotidyltransferase family protein [Gluconacetobacter azotocaptans]|uniref:nucleotidyltransferase family protein n=1 Tax=Gluconacetobacter azotocaptans TaxID=142834 RepID=UPI0038D1D497